MPTSESSNIRAFLIVVARNSAPSTTSLVMAGSSPIFLDARPCANSLSPRERLPQYLDLHAQSRLLRECYIWRGEGESGQGKSP